MGAKVRVISFNVGLLSNFSGFTVTSVAAGESGGSSVSTTGDSTGGDLNSDGFLNKSSRAF